VKFDSDLASDILDVPRGMVFGLTTEGDRHLMVQISYHGGKVVDLSESADSSTIH
jgi:hypothetical protein